MSGTDTIAGMGPVERAVYDERYRERIRFAPQRPGAVTLARAGSSDEAEEDIGELGRARSTTRHFLPPAPIRIATELAFARMIDWAGDLTTELGRSAPVVLVDVPEGRMLEEVRSVWRKLVGITGRVLYLGKATAGEIRDEYEAAALIATEPVKARDRDALESAVITALSWAVPIIGISPSAAGHVPAILIQAARYRLTLPPLDHDLLARTIRLVTGRRCRPEDLEGLEAPVPMLDLAVAIRHDRNPAACIGELRRLQASRRRQRSGRDLTLDELHGLDPAVDWARNTIADLDAWRRGEIAWDALDHGIVLDGPPGTGKTLFAQTFASTAGLPLISGSLAKWQSAGHLGDLLKAMRRDFDQARAQAPAILFIDEVDSFPRRDSVTHDHKDYVVEVVNGFIELLDGTEGREGLLFIAASNDVSRCDPALLRAGRLNRIVRIELPDLAARAGMLRVRLGSDLPDADLDRIARLAERLSGADIERLVKDARRRARQAKRELEEQDLLASAQADQERSPALLRRIAIHEASHALVAVLLTGPEGVSVTLQSRDGMAGWVSQRGPARAGTRSELEADLAILLAGRAGEELVLGEPSAGAGGAPGSDLYAATRIAAGMVGSLGLAGPTPHVFTAPLRDVAEVLSYATLHAAVVDILEDAERHARGLLTAHRPVLDRLVDLLIARRHADGETIAGLIAEAQRAVRAGATRVRSRNSVAGASTGGRRRGAAP